MKKIILTVATCFIGLATFAVSAQNSYLLRDTAVSYFTKEDASIYSHAQYNALDNTKDGQKSSWSNPKTSAHGYFIPSHTRKENGILCRDLTIFNFAEHRTAQSTMKFCKIKNEWKIV